MRVAIVTCDKYSDAWPGFFGLMKKFWPDCPYSTVLVTDSGNKTWGQTVADFTRHGDEPILLMLEDYFLAAPVRQDLIEKALEQYYYREAGCVRLYPCPGADKDYGNPHYGLVERGSKYRISLQSAIWRPSFLHALASRFDNPWHFETQGTKYAEKELPEEVLAFKRESGEWPIQYLCSAISRGLWNPDAKTLCDQHGIDVDWTKRPFEA